MAERERAAQVTIASLFADQQEARLGLTRELADSNRHEQQARADAQTAELARQTLQRERDEEKKRKEEAESQITNLALEVGNKDDALKDLKKVVDEQGKTLGGKI